jgi:hypothetical protein
MTIHETTDPNPERLRIEEWERKFMKQLSGLIPSPRAAKRFVNIYQILRTLVDEHEHRAFVGDKTQGQYQAVLLLLAILTGYPTQATQILSDLQEQEHPESWWNFIDNYELQLKDTNSENGNNQAADNLSEAEAESWLELLDKLKQIRTSIPDRPCKDFSKWVPEVARYSFRSGRIPLTQRGSPGNRPTSA